MGYVYVTAQDGLPAVAEAMVAAPVIGVDLETTGKDPLTSDPRLVSIWTPAGTWVVDLFKTGDLGPIHKVLHNPEEHTGAGHPVVVWQNGKFDQKFLLHHYGVECWPVFDTFRASHLCYNGKDVGRHDLDSIGERELGVKVKAGKQGGSDWSGQLSEAQLDYAAADVAMLPLLREALFKRMHSLGLLQVALWEFGAILPEASMELNGFRLDPGKWLALAQRTKVQMLAAHDALLKALPHPTGQMGLFGDTTFNLDSTQQLLASLARLGIRDAEGAALTSSKVGALAMVASKWPVCQDVIAYKKLSKRVTSFGEEYLRHLHPSTGRVHTEFWPFTEAGRYTCKPNLQQLPRGIDYRDCFRPEDGRCLLAGDYGQIELRLAAEASQDPLLLKIFREGLDPHRQTGAIIAGVPYSEVTSTQRQHAKPLNFGLLFTLGAEKFVVYAQKDFGVTMSVDQAKATIRKFFKGYARLKEWQNETLEKGKRTLICRTPAGRIRYMKEGDHGALVNTGIQGGGADGLKNALRRVYRRLRRFCGAVRMVHMVHDEISLEGPDDKDVLEDARRELDAGMIEGMRPMLPSVPVVVDSRIGHSWGECH